MLFFKPKDEEVMVVHRKELFGEHDDGAFNGFVHLKDPRVQDYNLIILDQHKFLWRNNPTKKQQTPAESDFNYKQIIPYCIIKSQDSFFIYKRLPKAGEKRLHDKWTFGVGGHINPIPMSKMNKMIENMPHDFEDALYDNTIIEHSMKRELHEEVKIDEFTSKIIGYINNDNTDVGKHHIGIVYLIELKEPNLEIKEKNKMDGEFKTRDELKQFPDELEGWSKILLDRIKLHLI